jgi:hypothetical protein
MPKASAYMILKTHQNEGGYYSRRAPLFTG